MSSKSFGSKGPAVPHLVRGQGGVSGEVKDLRADAEEAFVTLEDLSTSGTGPICVEEFTNPPAADVDGVLAAVASQAVAAAYVAADLVGGAAVVLDPPRNVTLTCDDSAPTWAGNATVTGLGADGLAQTQVLAFTNNTTTNGTKAFARVDSVAADAQNDANGTWSIGFGVIIGLGAKAKTRTGGVHVLGEMVDAARVTNGVFATAVASPPYGTYTPNSAPNGAHDYAVTYEKDMS